MCLYQQDQFLQGDGHSVGAVFEYSNFHAVTSMGASLPSGKHTEDRGYVIPRYLVVFVVGFFLFFLFLVRDISSSSSLDRKMIKT